MAVVCQHWLTNGATTCDAPPTTFPFHGPSLIVCLLRRLSLESGKLASNNSNETREKTKTRILIPRLVIQSALNFKANEIARLSLRPTFFFSLSLSFCPHFPFVESTNLRNNLYCSLVERSLAGRILRSILLETLCPKC